MEWVVPTLYSSWSGASSRMSRGRWAASLAPAEGVSISHVLGKRLSGQSVGTTITPRLAAGSFSHFSTSGVTLSSIHLPLSGTPSGSQGWCLQAFPAGANSSTESTAPARRPLS